MMKRRKWLISLVVLGVIMDFSVPKPKAGINGDVSLDSLAVRDTVALPPLSYSMKVGKDTLILPDSSKAWNNFFNELDSFACRERYGYHDRSVGGFAYPSRTFKRSCHAPFPTGVRECRTRLDSLLLS